MRELEKQTPIEITQTKEDKKVISLIGSTLRIKGLTLWEYNKGTNALVKAKHEKQVAELTDKGSKLRNKVITNENCYYFQKLNRKNAIDHLVKYFGIIPN